MWKNSVHFLWLWRLKSQINVTKQKKETDSFSNCNTPEPATCRLLITTALISSNHGFLSGVATCKPVKTTCCFPIFLCQPVYFHSLTPALFVGICIGIALYLEINLWAIDFFYDVEPSSSTWYMLSFVLVFLPCVGLKRFCHILMHVVL